MKLEKGHKKNYFALVLKLCYHYDILQNGFKYYTERWINPLKAELNPICHLLALLGGATIVVVSRLRLT